MKKTMNRWVYAITGIIVLLFAGMIYSWSVLSGPMVGENGWTEGLLTWASTIVMAAFCLGGFFGGLMAKKFSVKINLFLSAILFIAGFGITSIATSIILVYLGFGLLGGFASGFAYNGVMSTVSKWFPDKQGLISGILLMGFGIGSFLIGKVYTALIEGGATWQSCFFWLGVICAVVVALGGVILVKPKEEQIAVYAANSTKKQSAPYEEVSTGQMLKRSSFWFMFIWAILVSVAGLAVIFLGRPIAVAAVPSLAEAPGTIATVVGLISVCNAVARIFFGGLFDKIGYRLTLLLCSGMFILSMVLIILAISSQSIVLLFISYIVTGLSYGGVTPPQSAFVNKFYGSTFYPVNFSLMVMNLLISSFGSKLCNAVQTSLVSNGGYTLGGSYIVVLIGVIGLCVISIVMALLIKKPKCADAKPEAAEPAKEA